MPTVIPVSTLGTTAARRALEAAVVALANLSRTSIVLDCSAVDGLDSDGVAVLLDCWRATAAKGGRLNLINVSTRLRVLLELTRLSVVFPDIADTVAPPRRGRKPAATAA